MSKVADTTERPAHSWIDRFAPLALRPYLKLARVDRPIGTWLLVLPCWWSVALAAEGAWPDLRLSALFAVGALVMRGAGCTINDIVDRDIDARVARTRIRPLASGAVSLKGAFLFLTFQLALGLVVLLQLTPTAILLGAVSLPFIAAYPFMKRITYWPQAFLGLIFNWGALMGWAAVKDGLDWPAVALYVACLFWTLGYDTIYAHQDKEDDALLGMKSTALKLAERTKPWLWGFYAGALAFLALAGALAGLAWPYFAVLAAAAAHFAWQVAKVDLDRPEDCLTKFVANKWLGLIVFAGIVAGQQPI
ncbi:MAG: 4-hydroxybenzoate octaprenyltransferase [Alphaproteobacteria bacterium]